MVLEGNWGKIITPHKLSILDLLKQSNDYNEYISIFSFPISDKYLIHKIISEYPNIFVKARAGTGLILLVLSFSLVLSINMFCFRI